LRRFCRRFRYFCPHFERKTESLFRRTEGERAITERNGRFVERHENGFPVDDWRQELGRRGGREREQPFVANFADISGEGKEDNAANEEAVNPDDDSSPGLRLADLQSAKAGAPTRQPLKSAPTTRKRPTARRESSSSSWRGFNVLTWGRDALASLGEWLGFPGFSRHHEDEDSVFYSNGSVIVRVPKKTRN
jgi:hypothetical protein